MHYQIYHLFSRLHYISSLRATLYYFNLLILSPPFSWGYSPSFVGRATSHLAFDHFWQELNKRASLCFRAISRIENRIECIDWIEQNVYIDWISHNVYRIELDRSIGKGKRLLYRSVEKIVRAAFLRLFLCFGSFPPVYLGISLLAINKIQSITLFSVWHNPKGWQKTNGGQSTPSGENQNHRAPQNRLAYAPQPHSIGLCTLPARMVNQHK